MRLFNLFCRRHVAGLDHKIGSVTCCPVSRQPTAKIGRIGAFNLPPRVISFATTEKYVAGSHRQPVINGHEAVFLKGGVEIGG